MLTFELRPASKWTPSTEVCELVGKQLSRIGFDFDLKVGRLDGTVPGYWTVRTSDYNPAEVDLMLEALNVDLTNITGCTGWRFSNVSHSGSNTVEPADEPEGIALARAYKAASKKYTELAANYFEAKKLVNDAAMDLQNFLYAFEAKKLVNDAAMDLQNFLYAAYSEELICGANMVRIGSLIVTFDDTGEDLENFRVVDFDDIPQL